MKERVTEARMHFNPPIDIQVIQQITTKRRGFSIRRQKENVDQLGLGDDSKTSN